MTKSGERDLSRISPIDYALMTTGSCLAVYSGSYALSQTAVGAFCVLAILLGACFSYVMRTLLLAKPIIRMDGYLYALGIVVAFAFGGRLQVLLPDGGYPLDVMAAGWLSWMLIFGSFFTWQDSTLLFQAIPAIAFFGLSGIYDTFRGVSFAFFGFLLCMATLFGRAHRRAMLVQAAESGYFTRGLAPGTPTPSVETTPGLAKKIEAGPWRWIAGPEWALVSAMAIIVISLAGAPVVKTSMSGVSGFLHVPVPASVARRPTAPQNNTTAGGLGPTGETFVGRGANHITHDKVFEIRMPGLHYLRQTSFDEFQGRSWRKTVPPVLTSQEKSLSQMALDEIKRPQMLDFEIRPVQPLRQLPVPGTIANLDTSTSAATMANGEVMLAGSRANDPVSGHSVVPDGGEPAAAQTNLPPEMAPDQNPGTLQPRTIELVNQVINGAKTDYEKAEKIREAIAGRIRYNLDVAAIPTDVDPVDYTLFDHPEGYCDIFATAMTLMARQAGIPARYVLGYLPEAAHADSPDHYVVLESDYHAWAELYFKDFGWVVFDATEGAAETPGAERGAANVSKSWTENPLLLKGLNWLLGISALSVIGYIGLRIRRKAASRTPATEIQLAYLAFVGMLERATGVRREVGQTPDEYVTALRPALGEVGPAVEGLNRRFVRHLYSPESASADELKAIRLEIQSLKAALRKAPAKPVA